jgi:hypothetical protein
MMPEQKRVVIVGTGHEISNEELEGMKFIGTCLLESGTLILHIFVKE